MGAFNLTKYDIYIVALPIQNVTKTGENGKAFTTQSTEMSGDHRCIIVSVDPNGQYAVVIPLSSAQDSQGAEKWHVIKKSWLRLFHKSEAVYAMLEQIRYADRAGFRKQEVSLGEYDITQLDLKLKAMLGFL
jgi:hypothetical protein